MIEGNVPSQAPWLAVALVTAVLSLVGGCVGGFLGVWLETKKLIKQRAFDRRLDWYVRMVKTVADLQFVYNGLNLNRAKRDSDNAVVFLAELSKIVPRMSVETKEALLFGSPEIVDSLEIMTKRLNEIVRKSKDQTANEASEITEESEVIAEFARVHSDLARDVRRHLGLESLSEKHFARSASLNTSRQ